MASHSFQCEAGLEHLLCKGLNQPTNQPTNQNGLALEHASQEMKGDRELCMAAVAQDGDAIQYASAVLKADLRLIKVALQQQKNRGAAWPDDYNAGGFARRWGIPKELLYKAWEI